MITITKDVEVEIEVDLEDFGDYELIDELRARNIIMGVNAMEILNQIYENRKTGKPYDDLLDNLIYEALGRI